MTRVRNIIFNTRHALPRTLLGFWVHEIVALNTRNVLSADILARQWKGHDRDHIQAMSDPHPRPGNDLNLGQATASPRQRSCPRTVRSHGYTLAVTVRGQALSTDYPRYVRDHIQAMNRPSLWIGRVQIVAQQRPRSVRVRENTNHKENISYVFV